MPFKSKLELSLVVFKFTVPAFRTLALIIAIVPFVSIIPAVLPFKVTAKLACPLLTCPFSPRGVRTVLLPNISPLVMLSTFNILGS